MDIYKTILKRRTIRKFKQKRISKKILINCLNAARLAPSAANLQPLEYILITKNLDEIFKCTGWLNYLKNKDTKPKENERPVAYIIIISNNKINKEAKYDVGFTAENIVLTAFEKGVSSCIIGALDREKIREILNIPKNYSIEIAVALGYPKQKAIVEKFKNSVECWFGKKDDLHVPKRKLKNILHEGSF